MAAMQKQKKMQQMEDKNQKKRASISEILSKHTGEASDEIQSINEAKNQEIINSLDKENFYDKVLSSGVAAEKAKRDYEKSK